MPTKKPRTTTKVASKPARRLKHPAGTTFDAQFIPSNAWHLKLGIEDGRSAVAFVIVVGVLLLGLVATILGWAKTVSDLRSEVVALRTEVTRLSNKSMAAESELAAIKDGKKYFTDRYQLAHLATSKRSGSQYFFLLESDRMDDGNNSPILRLRANSGLMEKLNQPFSAVFELDPTVSPNGRYFATFRKLTRDNSISLIVLDLDEDKLIKEYPITGKVCGSTTEDGLEWINNSVVALKLCAPDPANNETVRIDILKP